MLSKTSTDPFWIRKSSLMKIFRTWENATERTLSRLTNLILRLNKRAKKVLSLLQRLEPLNTISLSLLLVSMTSTVSSMIRHSLLRIKRLPWLMQRVSYSNWELNKLATRKSLSIWDLSMRDTAMRMLISREELTRKVSEMLSSPDLFKIMMPRSGWEKIKLCSSEKS